MVDSNNLMVVNFFLQISIYHVVRHKLTVIFYPNVVVALFRIISHDEDEFRRERVKKATLAVRLIILIHYINVNMSTAITTKMYANLISKSFNICK